MKQPRVISSVIKGLRILECISLADDGLRVSQIAEQLSVPRSNLNLFLNSLIVTGYVIKDPVDNRYYISEKLQHITELIHPNRYSRLIRIAAQEMRNLGERFDENVLLGVLNLHRLRIVHREIAKRSVRIVDPEETLYVPHVTAGGKAILAFLGKNRLTAYFKNVELRSFTDRSVTSREELLAQLEEIKRRGYATNYGEFQEEIMAVAAPIFRGNEVLAALVLQFPVYRHREEELEANAQLIIEASSLISAGLADAIE